MDLLEVGEWKVICPEEGYVIGSTNVKALDIPKIGKVECGR